jgi:DNA-binding NtrC family response regulator
LVIDDDNDVRTALGELLGRWGVAHDLAANGAEAREAAANGRYALILCDHRLPDAQGLNLLTELAIAQPDAARTLITADYAPKLLTEAEARGIPLLHKPLAPETLRTLVGVGQ